MLNLWALYVPQLWRSLSFPHSPFFSSFLYLSFEGLSFEDIFRNDAIKTSPDIFPDTLVTSFQVRRREHVKHSLRKPQVALLVTFWNADWCLTASNAKSSSGINYNDFDASFWLDLYPMLIISWNVNRASKKKSHFPSVNNGWGWMNTWKAIFESGSSSLPKKIVAEIGNSNESDVWWCRREGWDDTYCEDVGNWREYVILFQMQITIDVFHRKCVNKSPIETYFLGYMRGEADGILIA